MKLFLSLLYILILGVSCSSNSDSNESGHEEHDEHGSSIHVVSLNFDTVKTPLILVLWVLLAVGVKVLYHSVEKFAKFCPESCVLIITGLIAGLIFKAGYDDGTIISFDAHVFFLFLLPPIVLDAGWCMPPRHFFDNIGLILAFAIFGTIINSFGIGLGLHYLIEVGAINVSDVSHYEDGHAASTTIDMPGCLLFGSLIAAVDPVAVLAVFDTVHVNEVLHIIVEGESLLNDAVSVVLYKIVNTIVEKDVKGEGSLEKKEYAVGFIAFLVISGGGTLIGLVYAILTSVFTRTLTHVRVVEPLVVFFCAYLSYLTAELFHWSGILAIIFCGFGMRRYVEENISRKSHTTIKYFMKMLAVISESVIFMFLGLALVTVNFDINWGFIGFAIFLCLFFRSLVIVLFVYFSNKFRVQKIAKVDQFIMVYGGLRGAISFSLSFILIDKVPYRDLIITTTFAVIIFTVFIQGITIGPLVKLLHVRTHQKKKPSLNEEIIEHMMAHVMWGFEEIVGKHGENYYRQWFDHIDNTYLIRWLTNKKLEKGIKHGDAIDILQVFHNLEERDAMEMAKKHEVFDNINKRINVKDSGMSIEGNNVKAPQLPSVGDTVPCADPNVKYQRIDTELQMENDDDDKFTQIKDRTFAAMRLNSRPVPKHRIRNRSKMRDYIDDQDDYFYRANQPALPYFAPEAESHHSMPYHTQPQIEKRHNHHHKKRHGHHGDHHRKSSRNEGRGDHHRKHKHRNSKRGADDSDTQQENGGSQEFIPGAIPPDEEVKEETGAVPLPPIPEPGNEPTLDNNKPDEVKLYDFDDAPPEVDYRGYEG